MGPVGIQEMVFIFLLALVLFGPKKLPELGRTVARAIKEFRKAQSEFKATLQHHMSELERESESVREITRSLSNTVNDTWRDAYNYDSRSYDSHSWGGEAYSSQPALEAPTSGASATQDAEAQPSPAATQANAETTVNVNGTVPRTEESFNPQNGDPAHAAAEPNPVNG